LFGSRGGRLQSRRQRGNGPLPESSTKQGRPAEVWCPMIVCSTPNRRLRFFDHLVSARRTCPVAQSRTWIVGVFLLAGVAGFFLPGHTHADSCNAIVGKWTWFIGGEVTVNPDGTFTQQSGNAGTWECTDAARGRFTLRWRFGGYVNQLVLSADEQGLSS